MCRDGSAQEETIIFRLCKYTICAISWDEEKNRRNLELHGITFEDAARARPSKEWITALITANGEGMPWDW